MRFVYRHLTVIGNESLRAAEASECASDQGKFWQYHDILFQNWAGENAGAFSDSNLKAFAVKIGLDAAPFGTCLDSKRYVDRVRKDIAVARSQGAASTPTVFVNGGRIEGLADYAIYKRAIDEALGKAR